MSYDYDRIASVITYITDHFKDQPSLDEVAKHVHLSPYHFQRLFKEWVGVSPKKFLQYTTLEHTKKLLKTTKGITEAAEASGLSGSSRLHDLFVSIEGMTPGEYKNGGVALEIAYQFASTPFGKIIIGNTPKGITHLSFCEDEDTALMMLANRFPKAKFIQESDHIQESVVHLMNGNWHSMKSLKLNLKGTPFQLKVWEALLKIPYGCVATYGSVAHQIGSPAASRAVGTAIGKNPIAYLIPCHRVIQGTGVVGGYMWGSARKSALLGWETVKLEE